MFRVTRVVLVLMGVLALAIAASAVRADSVTFTSAADNTLIALSGGETINGGGFPSLFVGSWGFQEESILGFDVSSLKNVPNLQVNSVTLKLFSSGVQPSWTNATVTPQVHAISAANAGWVEGTISTFDRAQIGSSCWYYPAYTPASPTAWAGSFGLNTPTTDYDPTVLASQTLTNAGLATVGTEVDFHFSGTATELTNLLSGWLTTNAGLLIYDRTLDNSQYTRAEFYSKEIGAPVGANPDLRPQLVVDYVPEPGTLVLLISGLLGLLAYAWRKRR